MNFLVTGSEGNLGRTLLKKMIKAGHSVVGIDVFKKSDLQNPKYRFINQDIFMVDRTDRDLEAFGKIDIVVHLASLLGVNNSIKNPIRYIRDNSLSLLKILDIMDYFKIKDILYTSSSSIYGQRLKRESLRSNVDLNINDILSPYAASKAISEIILHSYKNSYDFNPVIFRLFDLYSEDMEYKEGNCPVLFKFCYQAYHDIPITIKGDGENKISFLYIKDVADILLDSMVSNKDKFHDIRGIYNLSFGIKESISLNQIIEYLETRLNKKLQVSYVPYLLEEEKFNIKLMATNSLEYKKLTSKELKTKWFEGIDLILKKFETSKEF